MPLAATRRRGARLKARFAVKGSQSSSRLGGAESKVDMGRAEGRRYRTPKPPNCETAERRNCQTPKLPNSETAELRNCGTEYPTKNALRQHPCTNMRV